MLPETFIKISEYTEYTERRKPLTEREKILAENMRQNDLASKILLKCFIKESSGQNQTSFQKDVRNYDTRKLKNRVHIDFKISKFNFGLSEQLALNCCSGKQVNEQK